MSNRNLTEIELIQKVKLDKNATELEQELANRLEMLLDTISNINKILEEYFEEP